MTDLFYVNKFLQEQGFEKVKELTQFQQGQLIAHQSFNGFSTYLLTDAEVIRGVSPRVIRDTAVFDFEIEAGFVFDFENKFVESEYFRHNPTTHEEYKSHLRGNKTNSYSYRSEAVIREIDLLCSVDDGYFIIDGPLKEYIVSRGNLLTKGSHEQLKHTKHDAYERRPIHSINTVLAEIEKAKEKDQVA